MIQLEKYLLEFPHQDKKSSWASDKIQLQA